MFSLDCVSPPYEVKEQCVWAQNCMRLLFWNPAFQIAGFEPVALRNAGAVRLRSSKLGDYFAILVTVYCKSYWLCEKSSS